MGSKLEVVFLGNINETMSLNPESRLKPHVDANKPVFINL